MINNLKLLCLFVFFICSCSPVAYKNQKNINEVLPNDFQVKKFRTSTFTLYGLLRPASVQNKSLHIYIEGDGLAWLSRSRPSSNPTPTDNVAQNLAKQDSSGAAVLYLARPCQYVQENDMQMCKQKYWTSHRLAPEVIDALDEAISNAKFITKAQSVSLVGYSGGGGAAALVAQRRDDVVFLGSVAGMLDHATWTSMHGVSPLKGSLNPVDDVKKIKNINQKHIHSTADNIVPPASSFKFCKEIAQDNACIQVQGLKHNADWFKVWDYSIMP